jgi:hypothetical protein
LLQAIDFAHRFRARIAENGRKSKNSLLRIDMPSRRADKTTVGEPPDIYVPPGRDIASLDNPTAACWARCIAVDPGGRGAGGHFYFGKFGNFRPAGGQNIEDRFTGGPDGAGVARRRRGRLTRLRRNIFSLFKSPAAFNEPPRWRAMPL